MFTEFFLNKRIFTSVLILLLFLLGVGWMMKLQVETLPEVNAPVIYAAVPLPGGAPEDVENLVTNPIEDKVAEIEGVQRVMSSSWENVSIVVVFFDENVNQDEKYKEFRSKVDEARALIPAEAMDPIVEEISFENLPMMFLGFPGRGRSQYEISRRASELKKRLEALPGVKKVVMKGATEKHIEVRVKPDGLRKYGANPLRLLIDKLGEINTDMPGGKVPFMGREYNVRVLGRFRDIGDLRNMVVGERKGSAVPLSKFADVLETYPEPVTKVHVDGVRGVTLGVMKKRGHGTIDVAERIRKALRDNKDVVVMADASDSVKHQMGELKLHAAWGICLVMLLLLLTLGFRVAAIVSFALPMSILMTFAAMGFKGMTLDMVSLFALLLALGMMVDNSIVVCENIFRHRTLGSDGEKAALEGTKEVAWPILSSTAAVVCAFMPMGIFLSGPIGEFTRPIPIVVTFALISSLVVANCFNPLLCARFIKHVPSHDEPGRFWGPTRNGYVKIMNWCVDHGGVVMTLAAVVLVSAVMLVVLKVVGLQLFPQLDTSKFYIDIKTPPGSTLEETTAEVKKIETLFDNSKYVNHYITSLGSSGTRVEIDDRIWFGSNVARMIVDLKPSTEIDTSHKQVIQKFRKQVRGMFDKKTGVVFLEKYLGPPVGAPINIQVQGPEYKQLGDMTAALRRMLEAEPGVVDIKDDLPGAVPQIALHTNQATLGQLGMTTHELGGFIFLTLTGYKIGDIVLGGEKKDIFLKIQQPEGGSIADMQDAKFNVPGSDREVSFSDLLTPEFSEGLSAVEHENGRRTVTIEANVAKGYEAERIVSHLHRYIPNMRRTLEEADPEMKKVRLHFGGETMLMDRAFSDLVTAVLVSLALIYLILLLEFRSTLQPLIILVCVPFALVGVILGLLIMGYSFSILAGVGLLCLIGIVVNNGIIYIDYANILQQRGKSRREACLEACLTRLRPIVLTKATVILGIMPLASAAASKTQFWKPLCWAIIWGLLIATALTLVIIPVAYYITEGWRSRYYRKRA